MKAPRAGARDAGTMSMIGDLSIRGNDSDDNGSAGPAAPWRAICLFAAGAFLGLGLAAFWVGILPGDLSVRQELLSEDHSPVHVLAGFMNYAGRWQILLPACVLLFWLSRAARRHWWLWVGVLIGSALIEHAFKFLVGRPRPSGTALGYPSGHTTAAAVFAVSVVYLMSRERLHPAARLAIQLVAVVTMLLVGWARVVLHAHWPTDVLGGFLLGAGCAAAAAWWETAREGARPRRGDGPVRAR